MGWTAWGSVGEDLFLGSFMVVGGIFAFVLALIPDQPRQFLVWLAFGLAFVLMGLITIFKGAAGERPGAVMVRVPTRKKSRP